ncbi:MAG TPA: cytochrome c-type biogenesis protein CcmH [Gaiellaceae bacterium]
MRALAVVAAALALAAPAAAATCTKHASQSHLETLLVCLECHTTLDESNSPFANQMKADVARRIANCQTEQQILNAMVAQFGTAVLSTPQTHGFDLIAWLLPLGGIALGAAAIGGGAWHWSRKRDPGGGRPAQEPALDADAERLVDDALARFDA